jgi:hypothetical protein
MDQYEVVYRSLDIIKVGLIWVQTGLMIQGFKSVFVL